MAERVGNEEEKQEEKRISGKLQRMAFITDSVRWNRLQIQFSERTSS